MNIAILDDTFDTLRTIPCVAKIAAYAPSVWNDHVQDDDVLAERLQDTEALVPIRGRTQIRRSLIQRLSALRLISQRSVYTHINVEALTERGIILSSSQQPGTPSHAAVELTWALILASLRQIPGAGRVHEGRSLANGRGHLLRGKTLGVFGYGRIGAAVVSIGERLECMCSCGLVRPRSNERTRTGLRRREQEGPLLPMRRADPAYATRR